MNEIPPRIPGESAAAYLARLKTYEDEIQQIDRLTEEIKKTLARRQKRIASITERVIIEREVRRALKDPSRGPVERFYWLPSKPEALGPLAPLFILISLIWQGSTKTDQRFRRGLEIRK